MRHVSFFYRHINPFHESISPTVKNINYTYSILFVLFFLRHHTNSITTINKTKTKPATAPPRICGFIPDLSDLWRAATLPFAIIGRDETSMNAIVHNEYLDL